MKRLCGAAALVGVIVVGLSCGDGTGPRAGNLEVRLTSPNSGLDSAIVLTVTGPEPLTGVTPGTGLRLFQQPLGGTTTRFALTGLLTHNQVILTIGVTDVGAFGQYSASIQGIARPNHLLRTLPGGYALAVTR
ncbi:MAG: hypothetical protein ACREMN_06545 [Gemmatimonadales bacterium]